MITNLRMELFQALISSAHLDGPRLLLRHVDCLLCLAGVGGVVVAWLLPVVLLPVVPGGGGVAGGVAAVAGGGVVAGEDVHLAVVVHLQLPVHGVPAQLLNTDRRWLDG